MPSTSTLSIAIIGGGPAGLTLARLLHIHNLVFTVFESDTSPSARGDVFQGGTLDLHESSGQRALKAAGLLEEFHKVMRVEGEAFRLADKTGHLYIDDSQVVTPVSRTRPEIDRLQLRRILLDSIPPATIRWGSRVRGVEGPDAEGRCGVVFQDPTEFFDIVVGADGAWSKVRSALTDAQPHYSGISGLDVRFSDVSSTRPRIADLVGLGSYFAFSDSKAILAQRNGDGSVRSYAMLRTPEDWVSSCGIDFSDAADTKAKMVAQYYSDWDESLQDLIRLADDDSLVARKFFMLPIGLRWVSKPGVTLIGDAAHLMTPFSGVGVNLAMEDALELALSLSRVEQTGLAGAIGSYEAKMFARAEENAADTWKNLGLIFRDDAPNPFYNLMLSYTQGADHD